MSSHALRQALALPFVISERTKAAADAAAATETAEAAVTEKNKYLSWFILFLNRIG